MPNISSAILHLILYIERNRRKSAADLHLANSGKMSFGAGYMPTYPSGRAEITWKEIASSLG